MKIVLSWLFGLSINYLSFSIGFCLSRNKSTLMIAISHRLFQINNSKQTVICYFKKNIFLIRATRRQFLLSTVILIDQQDNNKIMRTSKQKNKEVGHPYHSLQMDKGKRHYWQGNKGDYGIIQSDDRRFYQRLYTEQKNNRDSTSQKNVYQQTPAMLYHSLKHNDCCHNNNEVKISNPIKKKLNFDSKNIQIKLPCISVRKDIAIQSEDVRYREHLQNYNNSAVVLETKTRPIRTEMMQDKQRKARVRTQFDQHPNKARKIRYSPTYVCSMRNPLPTFKLYNPQTRNPVYSYGFNNQ